MSVASADCSNLNNTTTPIFCYGTNGTDGTDGALNDFSINTTPNLSWNGTSADSNGLYTLTTVGGTGNPVDITLQFDVSTNIPTGSLSNEVYTITMGGNVSNSRSPVLLLQSNRGIDMQEKTLTFNFNSGTTNSSTLSQKIGRKMALDLSGVTGDLSFKGNLTVMGGRAQKWHGENYFEAKFGSNVEGNIALTGNGNGANDLRSNFTFMGDLIGNISMSNLPSNSTSGASPLKSGNTFTFGENSDQRIEGNITNTGALGDFVFSGTGNKTIAGDITANNGSITNLTFSSTGTNTITGNVIASGGTNTITSNLGSTLTLNNITFSASSGGNTITIDTLDNSSTVTSIQATGGTNTFEISGGILGLLKGSTLMVRLDQIASP